MDDGRLFLPPSRAYSIVVYAAVRDDERTMDDRVRFFREIHYFPFCRVCILWRGTFFPSFNVINQTESYFNVTEVVKFITIPLYTTLWKVFNLSCLFARARTNQKFQINGLAHYRVGSGAVKVQTSFSD